MPHTPRLFALALLLVQSLAGATEPPTNIVFILADDLGVNDLGCYGRAEHPTPHLARLAAQGMRFTAACAAAPVGAPTRAALLTGKSPARLHLTTSAPGRADAPSQRLLQPATAAQLPLEEVTIAERLKAAGYVSGCLGKWQLGGAGFGPKEQGFGWGMAGQSVTTPSAIEGGKGEFGLTEMAEQFLDTNKDRPFFLYLAYDTPHLPLAARADLVAKHRDAFNPVYAATIETLDECIGRIMARLDALRLSERTLVIFTSDNGGLHVPELAAPPSTHNTPFRAGKGFLYEGGLRVPLIVRWPGRVEAGARCAVPVISTDWMPTWLAVGGVNADAAFDGVSLLPLLTGGTLAERNLHWHFPHYSNQGGRPAGAIRSGNWKLVEHYEDGRAELFDLARDPGESRDLAGEEPARAADLRGQLAVWRESVGAQDDAPAPRFDPQLARALYQDVDVSRLELADTAEALRAKLGAWRQTMDAVARQNLVSTDERPVLVLAARDARIHGAALRYDEAAPRDALTGWTGGDDRAEWTLAVAEPCEYAVEVLYGCAGANGAARAEIRFGGQPLAMNLDDTGHPDRLVPRTIGRVRLAAGECVVSMRPVNLAPGARMNLRQITLQPLAEEAATR